MLKLSEKIFAIAMLFYTTSAVFPFFTGSQSSYASMGSNLVEFAIQSIFYLAVFSFIAIHWRTVLQGVLNAKWIICLTCIAIASTAWSQNPGFTLRRSIVLMATTAFGIYFGSRFTVPQQLRLLAWTCALVIFFSFGIAILLPRYGVDHSYHLGDWQGAFTQKNMLGRAMVLAVLVFYFVRPAMGRWIRWAGIASALALLVLSRSLTGALVFSAILTTLPLYRLLHTKITFAIPVLIALVLGVLGSILILTSAVDDIFQVLHRNATLSGRTDLWNAVVTAIMKRPWFGYGFRAFWQGMTGESATVLLTVRWMVPHSHNGFLDLLLDLGLLGLAVFALGYFASWRHAVQLVKTMRGRVPVWLCTYLIFMFFYNLTESSILVQNNIFWVLYTSTAVSLSLAMRVQQPAEEPVLQDEFEPVLESVAG